MRKLSHWTLTQKRPAIYDTESATAVEQTAKVYGAMNELIDEYNAFVDKTNEEIKAFEEDTNKDIVEFKTNMTKIQSDFIECVETKINEAVSYMKTNLSTSITTTIDEMKTNGELDEAVLNAVDDIGTRVATLENTEYALVYEDGTENLILEKTIKEGE